VEGLNWRGAVLLRLWLRLRLWPAVLLRLWLAADRASWSILQADRPDGTGSWSEPRALAGSSPSPAPAPELAAPVLAALLLSAGLSGFFFDMLCVLRWEVTASLEFTAEVVAAQTPSTRVGSTCFHYQALPAAFCFLSSARRSCCGDGAAQSSHRHLYSLEVYIDFIGLYSLCANPRHDTVKHTRFVRALALDLASPQTASLSLSSSMHGQHTQGTAPQAASRQDAGAGARQSNQEGLGDAARHASHAHGAIRTAVHAVHRSAALPSRRRRHNRQDHPSRCKGARAHTP
jgi:hypothetical protein